MTLRCPSCNVTLRVRAERLAGRARAKCPRCQGWVPLHGPAVQEPDPTAETVRTVSCASCGARLKLRGAVSTRMARCPRCRTQISLEEPASTPAAGPPGHDDSSSAATRRIDSRSLGVGLPGTATQPAGRHEVDLEEFVRSAPVPPPTPGQEPRAGAGAAASLMRPPVEALTEAAHEIQHAARSLGEPPCAGQATPSLPPAMQEAARTPGATEPPSGPGTPPRQASAAGRRAVDAARSARAAASRARAAYPFPAARGLAAGGLAGLLVGVAWAMAGRAGLPPVPAWLQAPVPGWATALGLPDAAVRALLPALLGALAGFVAAAAGSPRMKDRPLNLLRCGLAGLLTGLAAGLLVTLLAEADREPMSLWPALNWMRDLLVAGLLTPLLNRMIPSSSR